MKTKLTSPIPTRFTGPERAFLTSAARRTGLPASEIVRRSVRLLRRHTRTGAGYSLLIGLNR